MRRLNETTKYAFYGAAFGICFPLGSTLFLYLVGELGRPAGAWDALRLAHLNKLLFVIDTAPFFLGLFASLAGARQDRLRRFSESLEQQVLEKTQSLRLALENERKAIETIAHVAEHDPLTGLLNRRRFEKELERWIQYAERYERAGTLVFVDMDQFKRINDGYGHAAGDKYLQHVAETMTKTLRTTDIAARWGGDEFAILLPETTGDNAIAVANKLLHNLALNPCAVANESVIPSASFGLAYFPHHAKNTADLLAYADAAMYDAKEAGRGCWRLYSASASAVERIQAHIQWETRVRRALEHDQFVLLYQPVLHIKTKETCGYEALLRMEDRDGQLIGPGLFLESAERGGLGAAIDFMVLRKTSRRVVSLTDRTGGPWLSMNLGDSTLQDKRLAAQIQETLKDNPTLRGKLRFEVREQSALQNMPRLRELAKAIGGDAALILDDFGLGPVAFQFLEDLGVKMIKIDASIVREVQTSRAAHKLLRNIAATAHDYGIEVVAKFVEHIDTLPFLQKLGVDYAQGFAIGRPLESIEQIRNVAKGGAHSP